MNKEQTINDSQHYSTAKAQECMEMVKQLRTQSKNCNNGFSEKNILKAIAIFWGVEEAHLFVG